MTVEIQAVQRIRAFSESTFGTDASASLASFVDLPIREGSAQLTLTTAELDPQQMVQSRLEGRKKVLGPRSATLAFTMNLAPTGTAAGSATAAVTGGLGTLLKAVLGGETKGTGTTFASGSTAVVLNLTSAAGFTAGTAIGWVNTSGLLEVREIKSIAANVVTLKHGFSGSPANTNVAYASATYYPTEDPTESLQFLVAGSESDDRWLLLGGQAVGGITLALDPSGGQLPAITFNFTFASYLMASEAANTITGVIGNATYSNFEPIVGHAGDFRVFTVGAPTLVTSSLVHVSALTLNPKVNFVPAKSPSGIQTIYRWRAGRTFPPVDGSFTTFFEDNTWWSTRIAKTNKSLFYQMGQTAGSTLLVSAPTIQILNPQRAADGSQLAAQTIAFEGRRDTDTNTTTDLGLSPWRIHLV